MDFQAIHGFNNYSINNQGEIRNELTDRLMTLSVNPHGIVNVGMMRGGQQHKRSVAVLVANTFLDPPRPETFNTPIHLDGDQLNNCVDNLMWRPLWFARKYRQQFSTFKYDGPHVKRRIVEINTKVKFRNSWDAATKFGLLDLDIFFSVLNRYHVWPTYQEFRVLD